MKTKLANAVALVKAATAKVNMKTIAAVSAVGFTGVAATVPAHAAYTSPIADVLDAFPVDTITADMTEFVTSNLGLSLIFVISGVVLILIRRAFRG
jgi:hypothetical protein